MIERAIEQEIGVGAEPLPAALLATDGVMTSEPHAEPASAELVGGDAAAVDDESSNTRVRGQTVRFERISTVRVLEQNLAVIDRAIVEAGRALAADPGNAYLNAHFARTMRRKLDLLRQAATLTAAQS